MGLAGRIPGGAHSCLGGHGEATVPALPSIQHREAARPGLKAQPVETGSPRATAGAQAASREKRRQHGAEGRRPGQEGTRRSGQRLGSEGLEEGC